MSARKMKVEYDIDSGGGYVGYTDVGGFAASVAPGGGDRAHEDFHTFDGDTPIVGWGKLGSSSVVLKAAFTQADAQPHDDIYDAKINHYPVKLKWCVAGGAVGDKEFEVEGHVARCLPPGGEASSASVVQFEAEIIGPDYDESVVAA